MTPASRLRIGVIVDRQALAKWQADALRTLVNDADLLAYSCNNGVSAPRRLTHVLYYLLNLFTIRNRLTRRSHWPDDLPVVSKREFEAPQDGNWQELPEDLLEQLRTDALDVIVKFGMGLVRVPPAGQLSVPILSYHHGDPARYRGRPAGFYETLDGEAVMGQVVQRLSNRLDAGEIVAFAETKVAAHSYRTTLIEAYRHSPLILKRAIANCLEGRVRTPEQWGRNFHLPSNGLVLKFLSRQWRRAGTRLLYGLFKEKRWKVATVPADSEASIESVVSALSQSEHWRAVPMPSGYRFLADPFFHPDGGLLVEGMNERSCRGEILHVDGGRARRVSGSGGHYSYPATHQEDGQWRVIPEISEWSCAKTFRLRGHCLEEPAELLIAGRPALLDPTPFQYGGTTYLFANLAAEGPSVLRLWTAPTLDDEFAEHPSSPIRLSPQGSRMAGGILRAGGDLFRLGQDLRREYGDGLGFFRIKHIDRHRYDEELVQNFRFPDCRGPHTINLKDGRVAFDFYDEGLSPFAGFRRIKERRSARVTG
jgi:hypothetical protein